MSLPPVDPSGDPPQLAELPAINNFPNSIEEVQTEDAPVATEPIISEPELPQIIDDPVVEEPDGHIVMDNGTPLVEITPQPDDISYNAIPETTPVSDTVDYAGVAKFLQVDLAIITKCNTSIIAAVTEKITQFTSLSLEQDFLQVQLEQTTQLGTKRIAALEEQLKVAAGEVATLQQQQQSSVTVSTTTSAELELSRGQVSQLTTQVSQLQDEINQLTTDLDRQRQHAQAQSLEAQQHADAATLSKVELQQRINSLTQSLSQAENDQFASKLSLAKLENRIKYLEDDLNWHQQELALAQSRYSQVVQQHHLEQTTQLDTLAQLTTRNQQLEELNKGLKSTIDETNLLLQKEITKAADAEHSNKAELLRLREVTDRANQVMEATQRQLDQRQQRIDELEAYIDDNKRRTDEVVETLKKKLSQDAHRITELEDKVRRAEEALSLEIQRDSELPALTNGLTLIALEGNISLTDLYTEYSHLKKQLVMERFQKDKVTHQLSQFVRELEKRKPQLQAYQEQVKLYEKQLSDMTGKVELVRIEKDEANKAINRLRLKNILKENQLVAAHKLTRDLGRQVCYLLIHGRDDDTPLLADERKVVDKIIAQTSVGDASEVSDTGMLISSRLVDFKDIITLRQQNERLLVSIRELSSKLQERENQHVDLELTAIDEAKQAISLLQGELDSLTTKYDAAVRERDALKQLRAQPTEGLVLAQANADLRQQLAATQKVLEDLRQESRLTITKLQDSVHLVTKDNNQLQLDLSRAQLAAKLAETRMELAQKQQHNLEDEVKQLAQEIGFWREQSTKQEQALVTKLNQLHDADTELGESKLAHQLATRENHYLTLEVSRFKDEAVKLRADKTQLHSFISNLQDLLKEREELAKKLGGEVLEAIGQYKDLQQKLAEREERVALLAQQTELAFKAQNAKVDQVNAISRELMETRDQLAAKQREVDRLLQRQAEPAKMPIDASSDDFEVQQLQADLRAAEAQVEEFSNLARASEQALILTTSLFDDYKQQTDAKIAELETQYSKVEAERVALATKVDELTNKLEEETTKHNQERAQLKLDNEQALLKANSYDTMKEDYERKLVVLAGDVDSQNQLAQQNQDKFQAELKKSGEQVGVITQLQSQVDEYRTKVENANRQVEEWKAAALVSTSSNPQEDEKVEKLQQQIAELQDHNKLLLNQMELAPTGDSDGELVAYLRRETNRLEAQLASLEDEAKLLQIRVSKLEIDLAQAKLEVEFTRSQLASAVTKSVREEEKLSEQLTQINILRESNTTLRNEREAKAAKLEELTKQVAAALAQLDPLKAQVTALTTELEQAKLRARLVQEDGEKLRNDAAKASTDELEQQISSLKEKHRERVMQANTKLSNQNETISRLNAQLEEANAKVDALEKLVAEATTDIEPQLAAEREKVKAQTQQIFEMKMKMLQKKLDKYENKDPAGEGATSVPAFGQVAAPQFGGAFGGQKKRANPNQVTLTMKKPNNGD